MLGSRGLHKRELKIALQTTKVVQFCNEKLKVDLSDQNIDRAHRVGNPKENRSRAIIVRFKSHKDKIAVLRQRKELKSTTFYVNEDLQSCQ